VRHADQNVAHAIGIYGTENKRHGL